MNAGRELDVMIAEHVFGWQPVSGDDVPAYYTPPGSLEPHRKRVWLLDGKTMACQECGTLPEFSASIEKFPEIAEVLRKEGYRMDVIGRQPDSAYSIEHPWECRFYRNATGWTYSGAADTIPHAVCLAALRAKGCIA